MGVVRRRQRARSTWRQAMPHGKSSRQVHATSKSFAPAPFPALPAQPSPSASTARSKVARTSHLRVEGVPRGCRRALVRHCRVRRAHVHACRKARLVKRRLRRSAWGVAAGQTRGKLRAPRSACAEPCAQAARSARGKVRHHNKVLVKQLRRGDMLRGPVAGAPQAEGAAPGCAGAQTRRAPRRPPPPTPAPRRAACA